MNENPFEILGIKEDASLPEIEIAYRNMVKKYHPDLHPEIPDAAEKIAKVYEAYEKLTDPDGFAAKKQKADKRRYDDGNTDDENSFETRVIDRRALMRPEVKDGDSDQIKEIINLINGGNPRTALNKLTFIESRLRDARWNYIYAIASYRIGDTANALDFIDKASVADSENETYKLIYTYLKNKESGVEAEGISFKEPEPTVMQKYGTLILIGLIAMIVIMLATMIATGRGTAN